MSCIKDWIEENNKVVAKMQGLDEPYYGAIGGQIAARYVVNRQLKVVRKYYKFAITNSVFETGVEDNVKDLILCFPADEIAKIVVWMRGRSGPFEWEAVYTSLGGIDTIYNVGEPNDKLCLTDFSDW